MPSVGVLRLSDLERRVYDLSQKGVAARQIARKLKRPLKSIEKAKERVRDKLADVADGLR